MGNVSTTNELSSRPERSGVEGPAVLFIGSNLTCRRQVSSGMNNVSEVVITTITPNGSAPLPFVIPSAAEGSAVQSFGCNEFVIATGARSAQIQYKRGRF
jgi:hypothetical protein